MQPDPAVALSAERNLLLRLSYDGTRYHGWQVQRNAQSVQSVLQDALFPVLGGVHDLKGCSRTDTGVHAREYFVSVKTENGISPLRLQAALNNRLPRDIAVLDCREVPLDFHARYSCTGKEYVYQIWNSRVKNPFLFPYSMPYPYKLCTEQLNDAAQAYCGTHDFTSLCSAGSKKQDNTRTVFRFSVERDGPLVTMTTAADGYLYNMVRIMVGTLLRIAQGKLVPDALPAVIAAKDRSAAGPTAPACGLFLNRVFYGNNTAEGDDRNDGK